MTKNQRWGLSIMIVSLTMAVLFSNSPEHIGQARIISGFMSGLGVYLFTKT